MDDAELLRRWAAGDTQAAEEVVRRHFDTLLRFFSEKVDTNPDDLVQQTLLSCLEQRERLSHISTFRAYLFGIARNKLYQSLGDRYRVAIDPWTTSVAAVVGNSPISPGRAVDQQNLLDALRGLPTDLQIAIELRYWEGLSSAEISEVLDLPASTVRSRIAKGKEMLRDALGDEEMALLKRDRR